MDRTIRDAVNHRTAAYNAGLLSGNMSEYKSSCYALRRAVRAAKLRYRERIKSHFQLNDSRRMWQGLKTICSSGNKSSAEVRADTLLAEEQNTFYGRFTFTFTFIHLADAFIQSDLHCIQVTVSTFYQLLLSLGIEPIILALLAPCSTS